MAKKHLVKIWPRFFDAVESGAKTFEIRDDDRGYEVGDTLVMEEFRPKVGEYTGRKVERVITFVHRWDSTKRADDPVGHAIMPGYCVLALQVIRG
jgi:hypothetical protein